MESESHLYWSVMIPTYNPRRDYLEKSLLSVLAQDPGPGLMQIEVIDDCSTQVDVASMVREVAGDRVAFYRNPENLRLAGCWNACIKRARGVWVHLLHQDDFVEPGFYQSLEKAAQAHPEVGFLAARSFFVDERGIIQNVTPRLRRLENGGRDVTDFYYTSPVQCPGVVVRRDCYAKCGGFRSDLRYALDVEMWARIISSCGGLVLPQILSSYRNSTGNESHNLGRTASTLEDFGKLSKIFAAQYPDFDPIHAHRDVCNMALFYAKQFSELGDKEAAAAHMRHWRKNVPMKLRLTRFAKDAVRRLFG